MPRHRGRDDVEVFVVALDPVEWRDRREVLTQVRRYIADLHPEGDVWMPSHDLVDGVELAVDIAESADQHGRDRQERLERRDRPTPRIRPTCARRASKGARADPPCPRRNRPCCTPPVRSPCP